MCLNLRNVFSLRPRSGQVGLKIYFKQLILQIYMISEVNATSLIALSQLCIIMRRVFIEDVLRNYFITTITTESSVSGILRQPITLSIQVREIAVTVTHLKIEAKCNASRTLTGYIMENTGYRHNKKEHLR